MHKDVAPDPGQGARPVMDDRLSASLYDLQRWSQGPRGLKDPMPWESLYEMNLDGSPPKLYLLRGASGFRLSVEDGHDFAALRVPMEKRKIPSPQPYGAGEEVAPWNLPLHVVMAIPHIEAFQELHQGLMARDSGAPTFTLHASALTEMPSALRAENPDALAWVDTHQASLGGVRFFHAPNGRGRTKPDRRIYWSSGCLGRFPPESVARVCAGPSESSGGTGPAAAWNSGDTSAWPHQRGGQRTSLAAAVQ